MDYEEEYGVMERRAVFKISPQQAQQQAHKYVSYPAGARCMSHQDLKSAPPCWDCSQVQKFAHNLHDRKSGRFSEWELRQRETMRDCTLCDSRGLAKVRLDTGEEILLRCPHEPGALNTARVRAKERFISKLRAVRVQRAPGEVDYAAEVRKRLNPPV